MKELASNSDLIREIPDPHTLERFRGGANNKFGQAGGIYLYSSDNTQIMDFSAGLTGHNLGYNHPRLINSVASQMEQYARSGGYFDNTGTLFQLKNSLSGKYPSGMDSCFFTNTEADALKYALWLAHGIRNRPVVIRISFNPYGQPRDFAPTDYQTAVELLEEDDIPGSVNCSLGFRNFSKKLTEITPEMILAELLCKLTEIFGPTATLDQVCAIIVELGGEHNGFLPPPADVIYAIRLLCDQHGILFILDEGRAAIGRTGLMFASQAFEVDPDLIVVGKGIANEYSLGCIVIKHGFAAGVLEGEWNTAEIDPISCAAALATLDVIETEDLLCNCLQMGARLRAGLQVLQSRFPIIGEVRGVGLNWALDIVSTEDPTIPCPSAAAALVNVLLDRGLKVYRAGAYGNTLCLMPPLNVSEDQVQCALNILKYCLERH